jgi:hypothetical protein
VVGFQNHAYRLDFVRPPAQKQSTVSALLGNFYARWRLPAGRENVLRDENELPPEHLLQSIWHHQRLQRDRLRTADGQPVRVLHPGFVSVEGGPDFRGAVIQIGDAPPRSGDVEIDLRVGGWRAHGHDHNPAFKNVLLHVVWESDVHRPKTTGQSPPAMLALANVLDAPLAELSLTLENESPRVLPESLRGQCCTALRELDELRQGKILDAAARVRFQAKAEQFRARARHVGWEQALWEGLFRALGYKHNFWPMQNLAETRSRWMSDAGTVMVLQSRLLGIGGLLPADLLQSAAGGDGYLRRLWDCWWRERDAFGDCLLPRAVWKFHGLRPANHPQRRLALAAHWLADNNLIAEIENWAARELSDRTLAASLREILEVEGDEFWSWHWTFRSARLKKSQPLLGDARVTDLAVNVILPWLWTRAAEGRSSKLQRVIEQRYAAWPLAEDNAILRLARQRLLGAGRSRALRSASAQQGLIQITRDFCEQSDAVCTGCRFPELARGWNTGGFVQ